MLSSKRWKLPRAATLLEKIRKKLDEIISIEKKQMLDDERLQIETIRRDADIFSGDNKEAFFRSTMKKIRDRKWNLKDEAIALFNEINKKLEDFLITSERNRIDELRKRMYEVNNDDTKQVRIFEMNATDQLRSILAEIERQKWRLQSEISALHKEVFQKLKEIEEAKNQTQICRKFNSMLEARKNENLAKVNALYDEIEELCGENWLENEEWAEKDWIPDEVKRNLPPALEWREYMIEKDFFEEKRRRLCHLVASEYWQHSAVSFYWRVCQSFMDLSFSF